jgi:hypothetical protein
MFHPRRKSLPLAVPLTTTHDRRVPSKGTPLADLKLSSVLNMAGDFASVRRTLSALQAQTFRHHLEVILVTTASHVPSIDRRIMETFGAYQIVEVDSLPTGAYGWAEGFRRARAPIVVVSEDHGFPAHNWAETLIDTHAKHPEAMAVCPALENGNPRTLTSWANFGLSFCEWYVDASEPPRAVPAGAGHNTSYKRDLLLEVYGEHLDRWMNPERVMHSDIIARDKTILLDPRTRVAHVNLSKTMAYLGISFAGGRVFGASRAADWGVGRKLFYAVLFPLVPPIRLKRMLSFYNTPKKRRDARFVPALPLIIIGLACHAFGEAVGYLFGSGRIAERYTNYELRRQDYVLPSERREIFGLEA